MPEANLEGQLQQRNKNKLMAAYEAYVRREPASLDNLLLAVREFVFTKLRHLEYEFREHGTSETADDWAQEVLIKVWQGLDSKERTPETFYAWVHKLAFSQAADSFNYLKHSQRSKASLTIDIEDDDGKVEEIDNPELYRGEFNFSLIQLPPDLSKDESQIVSAILRSKRVQNNDPHHPYLDVGDWMDRARTDQEIADDIGISLSAYRMRVKRLRDRVRKR